MDERELLKERFKSAVSSAVKAISENFDLEIKFDNSNTSKKNSLNLPEVANLKSGFIAGLVIHAIDNNGSHKVVSFNLDKPGKYWLWKPSMAKPELLESELV